MIEEGLVYGVWLVVRKALPDTEKGFDATWQSVEAILDVILAYVLEI